MLIVAILIRIVGAVKTNTKREVYAIGKTAHRPDQPTTFTPAYDFSVYVARHRACIGRWIHRYACIPATG